MLRPTDRTLQFPEAPNQFSIFRNCIIYSSNPSSTPQTGIINNLGIRQSTNQEEENCEHVGQKEKEEVTVDLRMSTAVERKVRGMVFYNMNKSWVPMYLPWSYPQIQNPEISSYE